MKKNSLVGGLAGAVALTLVHETVRRFYTKAPRMDLMGMLGLSKIIRGTGHTPPPKHQLFLYTMAGDVVANALYYALAGMGNKKSLLQKGAALGIAAGIGALTLSKPLHLNEEYSKRTTQTGALTFGYYLFGGLVAAAVIKALVKNKS